ncbi:MAG: 2-oxoacid:acceptor oxidoreductase family protein [Candidatus Adiutrix sp.]|jgi:2-oxoglutarate ferredoxin oxidoreductase subunit gamma|nr:2-oxoacid:acceptor oxidoreductase family protein [Candidatus Adiutrix sp.]
MSRHFELLLGGSGGQGLVFVSSFIAKAAMADGLNAAQTQSYGIAQRGGFISAEVVVSDQEILYPKVTRPDLVIALHEAAEPHFVKLDSKVVFDSGLMDSQPRPGWAGLPFTDLARSLNCPKAANLIAFGAALHFAPFIPLEAAEAAARESFPSGAAEINIQALRLGRSEAVKKFRGGRLR